MKRLIPIDVALAIALASMLLHAPSAQAEGQGDWGRPLRTAQAALSAGDLPRAYALYRRQAGRNPLAQFVVGEFLRQGWARTADPVAACGWYAKAASHRIPTAEHLWADCLAQGIGRAKDIPAALTWYEQAAADGHLLSLCSAADLHIRGEGTPRDAARGIAMCQRAAEANSPPAMLQLAHQLETAEPPARDLAAARHWYEEAAGRGMPEAQYRLGLMLARAEGGPADPDAALFWLETAAASGHAAAYLPTAMLYGHEPVQPDTGALAPAHLAKIYLWTKAAEARLTEPAEIAQAQHIETQVLAVMPPAWRPDLDRQVIAHLSRFPPSPVNVSQAAAPAAGPAHPKESP